MKPTYEVRAWRECDWWIARVVAASPGADQTPLDSLTHARTLTKIEQTVRDLVATILDTDERAFDVEFEYLLPAHVETLVFEAIGASTWLEAARELWHEQSAAAVRALTDQGFSRRETAKLLGLSDHQLDMVVP
jgi:hypothetical protein